MYTPPPGRVVLIQSYGANIQISREKNLKKIFPFDEIYTIFLCCLNKSLYLCIVEFIYSFSLKL